mmetsp:Transcript_8128/g.13469  ORF Transcript_8128/g.13469 Transcript_8128/m.13469 type:complete len:198 (-) Transcript_8128:70-663(-)|eukprot:CAMPEP_0119004988 /NCGR_PEP_ID=MMETSP1176-20130426/1466_1 /TAXON_ID=265551 /ORGANISM="Synedropsis recta cf, Strain CCMP1620" /LENGTH=197 /DNA_ID=CAMNT_0006956749 /DNA_START=110 /DNA_END=703 /DNA_ORIENTATION=+
MMKNGSLDVIFRWSNKKILMIQQQRCLSNKEQQGPPIVVRAAAAAAATRELYKHFERRQTRWNDNDAFGHLNNAVYYNFMDDAVNMHLMNRGIGKKFPRFVAENGMRYFVPLAFPSDVDLGLRIVKLGTSSVTYDIGIFGGASSSTTSGDDDDSVVLAARGKFVHVYVCEKTGRPQPIAEEARRVLQTLLVVHEEES